jgi:Na+/H+ antiporter NhaD/arsenite permease-like protein
MIELIIGIAILGFLSIIFEDLTHIDKAKSTLFFGTLAWLIYFIGTHGELGLAVHESFNENLLDIASLWLFLFAAMTFVAYLSEKGVIQTVASWLLPAHIGKKTLLLFVGGFAFLFSSLADNITATLVSLALINGLALKPAEKIRYAVAVVYGVNAGGVSLITGDVTTLMIFLANKVAIADLLGLILPSFISVMILCSLLSFGVQGELEVEKKENTLDLVDWIISGLFFLTILLVIFSNVLFGVPPVLTFLFGLGLMFMVAQFIDKDEPMLDYIRKIEFDTLLFFLGVLLLVGILKEVHALDSILLIYKHWSPMIANYALGIVSAIFDNVPLTSALLKSGIDMSTNDWLTLTFSVGVGGAMLAIGSAAGVVAMNKVEGLTFLQYLKFTPALLVAYTCGYGLVLASSKLLAG